MNWCIIIPIIVGLLCALLGYLLGRLFRSSSEENNNDGELLELRNKITRLKADLEACRESKLSLKGALDACEKSKLGLASDLSLAREANTNIGSGNANLGMAASFAGNDSGDNEVLLPFDAAAAKVAYGKKIKQDDLKIVEGIGPKIEGLFNNFDIKTWKALSEASQEKCQEVLNSGGERYRIHNPGTWPEQAKLAYEGKWKELVKWQDELDGGKA